MHGIQFTQPEGWEDRSMVALNGKTMSASGVLPNFVITQDRFGAITEPDPVERIKAFAQKQVADMQAKLPSPVIISRALTQVSGRPAAEVIVTWLHGSVRLCQIVTFTMRDTERVVISTATCAEEDFGAQEPLFRTLIASLKING